MSIYEEILSSLIDKYPQLTVDAIQRADAYFKQFGQSNGESLTPESFAQATKSFQELFGLKVDGEFGPKTERALSYPRCGCKDVEHITEDATGISRWGISHLKWYIEDYLDEFSKDEMASIIKSCADYTSSRVKLTFEQVNSSNKANIVFTASNNPKDEMGQKSGVLAWCELPPKDGFAGQIVTCFDIAENWLGPRGGNGIKYPNVLMHEVFWGHGMGLSHSKLKNCLMSPFYNPEIALPVEPDDDAEMFRRYEKVTSPPQPPPTPNPQKKVLTLEFVGDIIGCTIPGFRTSKIGA